MRRSTFLKRMASAVIGVGMLGEELFARAPEAVAELPGITDIGTVTTVSESGAAFSEFAERMMAEMWAEFSRMEERRWASRWGADR